MNRRLIAVLCLIAMPAQAAIVGINPPAQSLSAVRIAATSPQKAHKMYQSWTAAH